MEAFYYRVGQISIGIFILLILIAIILVVSDRQKLDEMSKTSNYLGGFNGGTFFSQPFVPLDDVQDEEMNQIIKTHNKKIKLFYFSFVFLIMAIVFFNLAN